VVTSGLMMDELVESVWLDDDFTADADKEQWFNYNVSFGQDQ